MGIKNKSPSGDFYQCGVWLYHAVPFHFHPALISVGRVPVILRAVIALSAHRVERRVVPGEFIAMKRVHYLVQPLLVEAADIDRTPNSVLSVQIPNEIDQRFGTIVGIYGGHRYKERGCAHVAEREVLRDLLGNLDIQGNIVVVVVDPELRTGGISRLLTTITVGILNPFDPGFGGRLNLRLDFGRPGCDGGSESLGHYLRIGANRSQ